MLSKKSALLVLGALALTACGSAVTPSPSPVSNTPTLSAQRLLPIACPPVNYNDPSFGSCGGGGTPPPWQITTLENLAKLSPRLAYLVTLMNDTNWYHNDWAVHGQAQYALVHSFGQNNNLSEAQWQGVRDATTPYPAINWSFDGCSSPKFLSLFLASDDAQFLAACQVHDLAYRNVLRLAQADAQTYGQTHVGGTPVINGGLLKAQVDDWFLSHMSNICRENYGWYDPRRSFCLTDAYGYYSAVDLGGYSSWNSTGWEWSEM